MCMRRSLYLIITLALLWSCKKAEERRCFKSVGDTIEQTVPLGQFDALMLFDGLHYVLIQDSTDKLVIKGGENLLNSIDISVEQGLLTIKDNNKCTWLRELPPVIVAEIHYTNIDYAHIEAHGPVTNVGTHRGDELVWESWHVNTQCELDVDVRSLSAKVNGGGSLTTFRGRADEFYVHWDGLGIMDGSQVQSGYYWANNLSVGQVLLDFPSGGRLDYLIQSYGDILYTGVPDTIVQVDHSGSGQLMAQ